MGKIHYPSNELIGSKLDREYGNLLFCFAIGLQAIMTVFCQSIRLFVSTRSLDTLFIYGLLALVIVRCMPKFNLKIRRSEFAFICFYFVIWFYSYLTDSGSGSLRREVFMDVLQTCLVVWIGSRMVQVTDTLLRYMRITAYIFLIRFPLEMFVFSTGIVQELYSQYSGYQLYIGFTLLLVPMLIQRKWYDYIAAVLFTLFTLITGARGPFVFLVMAFVLCMLVIVTERRKFLQVMPLIAVATAIIAANLQTIMTTVLGFVNIRGGSARTIQTILNGNIFSYLAGRQNIYPIAWQYIIHHPFFGSGFANDRAYVAQQIGSFDSIAGDYAHNIFLEIGMQFGLILGVLVIIVLARLLVGTYKRQSTIEGKLFYTALLCSAILPLLVSGSYLTSPMFYAVLGFSFADMRRREQL